MAGLSAQPDPLARRFIEIPLEAAGALSLPPSFGLLTLTRGSLEIGSVIADRF